MPFLAIVNPAAGGGRCRNLVGSALARLRSAGLAIEVAETAAAGDATRIARDAYRRGFRKFLAVGGDGTSFEIVNGLFPDSQLARAESRPTSAPAVTPHLRQHPARITPRKFLSSVSPPGHRQLFSTRLQRSQSRRPRLEHALQAIERQQSRACDVLRLTHTGGDLYFINLASVGFAADVAALRHRRFLSLGHAGYLASIFLSLARLKRRPFPVRINDDEQKDFDRRRCLFLTFNNSKFTGGTMMIAPDARTDDGLIEYVRWGPISRLGLIKNLPTLYDGTHTRHPLAEHRAVKRVEFQLDGPVDVMIDGEVASLQCLAIDVLPSALQVLV